MIPDYDPMEPRHCFSNNLQQTARAVARIYAEALKPVGLTRAEFPILESLAVAGPMTASRLAARLYMDRSTLTRKLVPLEKAGLVDRVIRDDDRRARPIRITRAGEARRKAARACWRRAQQQMLELYGAGPWQELEGALRTLRQQVASQEAVRS
ncbi:MAG: MarR family winged helix-turn-helix transcriptional regulator [Pseudomonadales bacterium]|jgi:DNA-binding MarR family transcriptional regulator|nr:MarR family winged helix-turn-helix transcriptional regulator [Pseudomonadales bacterium]